ncbi:MAG: hypothetical protein HY815_17285 [Candidatus Riflebacteria bacterium]|nr:hypothetical protein [Candidatus Riflebacteria bacterium]
MNRLFAALVLIALLSSAVTAQTISAVAIVDPPPPNDQVVNTPVVKAGFRLQGFTPPVRVQFFRMIDRVSDGAVDTMTEVANGTAVITIPLMDALQPGQTGTFRVSFNAVAVDSASPPNVYPLFDVAAFQYVVRNARK